MGCPRHSPGGAGGKSRRPQKEKNVKTTAAEKTEKAAAAFCAAAANLTTEVRAAGVAARKAARRAAGVPFRETKAEAARAAQATREAAARAETLLDAIDPEPYGAGPTFEALVAAHMALDTAARVALQAADQAANLA